MSGRIQDHWQGDQQLVRAMLADRRIRRRWLGCSLMLALAMMVLGLWVLDGWLAGGPWRFLLWWGGCGLLTLWVILFALYDALLALREQKKE